MRLLYVVTEDWYFLSHRLPMARAARDAGFEVHVATRVVDGAAAIRAEGFVLHPVPFVRGRIAPFGTAATIRALRDIHRSIAPDIVPRRLPAGAGSPASPGSGMLMIYRLSGREPTSQFCHRGAKDCRKACSRPQPAAGR